jgi:hypothetical protein
MPVIVVILTAVVSGYLVPSITKQWQDHERALEIKISLVETINSEVMQILLATQLAQKKFIEQKDFDNAYRIWEVQRAVIAGKLRAYFERGDVASEFEALANAITEFYALTGTTEPKYRSKRINVLRSYFGDGATDWRQLGDLNLRRTNWYEWEIAWWGVRQACLERKDAIIQYVLSTPVAFLEG